MGKSWECSTVGSALALQARGHEFESRHFHRRRKKKKEWERKFKKIENDEEGWKKRGNHEEKEKHKQ